ncbi:uncharacterized protein PITG_15896 [Phytophthora infestans T30-4]|uniref:Uncharacterized protein n=1 Tax=Phytophthora infestans (strain T30-4) TaxID=403677 RepID=D0NS02_PHYIT|nr:uncharacterized protein PITG_15896 [Phytophthora infestans T30-4]EEY63543.1 hypothetical protein PITG_15896 [Phytophthora infestans T30-4]|eukprot:XP_002898130.1 hypothetical protein PITG_15896 [Phytophthora infestans T30-4]
MWSRNALAVNKLTSALRWNFQRCPLINVSKCTLRICSKSSGRAENNQSFLPGWRSTNGAPLRATLVSTSQSWNRSRLRAMSSVCPRIGCPPGRYGTGLTFSSSSSESIA